MNLSDIQIYIKFQFDIKFSKIASIIMRKGKHFSRNNDWQ